MREMGWKEKKSTRGKNEQMKAEGGMERNEERAWGIAAISEVINVVLTRVYPRAQRSRFNRKNKGQFKVWVKSNVFPK